MRNFSHNLKHNMEHKNDVVTVVREDGKEFVIQRKALAEHINRGFTVKDDKDQPSEEELKAAVGFKGSKGNNPETQESEPNSDHQPNNGPESSSTDRGAVDDRQEPDEQPDTIPEKGSVAKNTRASANP